MAVYFPRRNWRKQMAYPDNNDLSRDKYGNVVRDPAGTGQSSFADYWQWILAAIVALIVLWALFGSTTTPVNDRTASPDSSTSQPLTPKEPPAPPANP
jgi:hypothetical protein